MNSGIITSNRDSESERNEPYALRPSLRVSYRRDTFSEDIHHSNTGTRKRTGTRRSKKTVEQLVSTMNRLAEVMLQQHESHVSPVKMNPYVGGESIEDFLMAFEQLRVRL